MITTSRMLKIITVERVGSHQEARQLKALAPSLMLLVPSPGPTSGAENWFMTVVP